MKNQIFGWLATGLVAFATLGLVACEEKGPMEKAGERMDDALGDTGEAIDEAANDAKRKLEDAAD